MHTARPKIFRNDRKSFERDLEARRGRSTQARLEREREEHPLVSHVNEVLDGLAHGSIVDHTAVVYHADLVEKGEDVLSALVDGEDGRERSDIGSNPVACREGSVLR
jgi:hypothetical protein